MIYIDSSSLLKLLWNEAESSAVMNAIAQEDLVLVSILTELETLVQLKAAWLGGDYSLPHFRQMEAQFGVLKNQSPYDFRNISSAVFRTALRQHRNSGRKHCRSLDRLHLAAMEELKVLRLMTHDEALARAALEAGFQVLHPRQT